MRILCYEQSTGKTNEVKDLEEAFKLGPKEVISIVGGGGKTTTCMTLSSELAKKGKKVIFITTTCIWYPEQNVYTGDSIDEIRDLINNSEDFIIVGKPKMETKLGPPRDDILEKLPDICDYLIVEADGSKMLPMKFPQSHEPVLHDKSTLVIGVVGIDALNSRIEDVCHRTETATEVLNKKPSDTVTTSDIAFILESKEGQFKNVTCRYIPLINKVDTPDLVVGAVEIAKRLKSFDCLIVSYRI